MGIEQELKESLSTNDYESINEEIEILNGMIESNSDISSEQAKNVLSKLESLHNAGKITDSTYENLKKSIQQSASLQKKKKLTEDQSTITSDTKTEIEDGVKALSDILFGDDLEKINAEIEELMKITPGDLENFNPKKEKLLNSLQHLYDNNKINGEQY